MKKNKRNQSQKRKPEPFIGDVQFRSPHNEFPEEARTYFEKKLRGLTRFFNTILSIHVAHEEQRGQHQVSIHLDADGKVLHLTERHPELRAAIDALLNRLEHQLVRYKERLKRGNVRQGRGSLLEQGLAAMSEEEANEEPQLVEVKRMDLKPMSVDEAILQIELLRQSFLVFRDLETDQFCVLYRRSDGHYGLLEVVS